jgi:hypothetical protein
MTAAITQIETVPCFLKEVIKPEVWAWRMCRHALIREPNHKPAMDLILELRYDDGGYYSNAVEVK